MCKQLLCAWACTGLCACAGVRRAGVSVGCARGCHAHGHARGQCAHSCAAGSGCAKGAKCAWVSKKHTCAWVCKRPACAKSGISAWVCKGLRVYTATHRCCCVCAHMRAGVRRLCPPNAIPRWAGGVRFSPPRLPLTPRPIPVGPDLLHRSQISPEKPQFPPERSGASAPVRPA